MHMMRKVGANAVENCLTLLRTTVLHSFLEPFLLLLLKHFEFILYFSAFSFFDFVEAVGFVMVLACFVACFACHSVVFTRFSGFYTHSLFRDRFAMSAVWLLIRRCRTI